MSQLRPPRGTHDLLGEEIRRHRHVAETARAVAARYGYGEIATPMFEFTEVFQRTLGETSDIVTKEMYTFTDRGGEQVTLRPENTAGVVRAMISGGLTQDLPQRFFYAGPMFRYERPQKGRLRQFHQIGIELVGAPEPEADVEAIALGADILGRLGVLADTALELNTLGDRESRLMYRGVLVSYLEGHRGRLSQDSLMRLERNPMRILDSKDEGDRAVVAEAPLLHEHLNQGSRDFFARVQDGLDRLGIAYRLSPRLVRGLDYYTHTAFEFVTTALGAQGAVMAGGRYDGLMKEMGGPDLPGVGWAAGIERLAMLAGAPPPASRPVALVPIGAEAEERVRLIAHELRHAGVTVDLAFKGKPGQRMKRADRIGARWAVSIGPDELARGAARLRDLDSGVEEELALGALAARLGG
ncbi:MAG: histidine--tRNA ligase [Geminicoccaceae bacterium]